MLSSGCKAGETAEETCKREGREARSNALEELQHGASMRGPVHECVAMGAEDEY